MGLARTWAGLLTGVIFIADMERVSAATYYVATTGNDSGPGTSEQPWRTLVHAADVMVAGDTTIVRDGKYIEDRVIFRNDGTVAAPITMRSEHLHGAYLASISGQEPAFYIIASYITIRDFRIGTDVSNVRPPGYVSKNNSVFCWASQAPTVANPTSGDVGCHITGNLIEQTTDRDGGMKISQDFSVIDDNTVYSEIELFNNRGSVIRNNTFYYGGSPGTYIVAKGGVRDAEIYSNVIHMNHSNWAVGIYAGGSTGAPEWFFDPTTCVESYNIAIYNNVILSEATNNTGLAARSDRNSRFFNNTLVGDMVGITLMRGGVTGVSPATHNPYFVNNIFKGVGASSFGSNLTDFTGALTIDYNDIYGFGDTPTQPHGFTDNPQFVNEASDWHVQSGSRTIDVGVTVTMTKYHGGAMLVDQDKAGVARQTPWDLGVYNYGDPVDTTPPAQPTNVVVN